MRKDGGATPQCNKLNKHWVFYFTMKGMKNIYREINLHVFHVLHGFK